MTPAAPGRVFGRALLAWGLGDLSLGRRAAAIGWLTAEVLGALLIAGLTVGLADTTLYLIPYLAGLAFIVAWAIQAVGAYRRAQRTQGAIAPTPSGSPVAAIAWLGIPLLLWGTGFWLVAASAGSPAAALDRFATEGGLCSAVVLAADCADSSPHLAGVRIRLVTVDRASAEAVAERVHYVSRPSRFMGIFAGSELVPVSEGNLLTIRLLSVPAATFLGIDVGARRWRIDEVFAQPGEARMSRTSVRPLDNDNVNDYGHSTHRFSRASNAQSRDGDCKKQWQT
ncbi:MAG: hypothetical protein M3R05_04005 [Chloroflexota bacterium]|nr:hypothetical protein [Chloroflexota bacterium]